MRLIFLGPALCTYVGIHHPLWMEGPLSFMGEASLYRSGPFDKIRKKKTGGYPFFLVLWGLSGASGKEKADLTLHALSRHGVVLPPLPFHPVVKARIRDR